MADLSESEFMARIGLTGNMAGVPVQDQPPTIAPISQPPAILLPQSADEVKKASEKSEIQRLGTPTTVEPSKWDSLAQLGARPGVPFDTSSGVPLRVRVAAEKEPTEDEKLASYKIAYGDENVRRNKFGQIIVTTTDDKGKTVDKLANPMGPDASDVATFIASSPELAGSILPLIATRGATLGPGVLKALATLGLTTGGAEITGAAKDVYQRWLRGEEANVPEIAQRRAVSGSLGLISGAALGAGGFVLGRVVSPFNAPGRLQLNARAARDMLNEKYGIDLKLSAAEETGSPILAAGEALESQKPGSRSGFSRFREKNLAELEKLRGIATGQIDDEEAAGKRVLTSFKGELTPLNYDVELAAQEAQKAASEAIKGTIGKPVNKVMLGSVIDLGAKTEREMFRNAERAKWNALTTSPKFNEPIIAPKDLEGSIKDFLEGLPKVRKEIEEPTGLMDVTGRPSTRIIEKDVPIETPIRPKLEELSRKLAGGKVSLNDLKGMRTDVGDAVKSGEALTGVRDGRLERLYAMFTDAIDNGLEQVDNSPLKKAWQEAVTFTKEGHARFERAGIAEMFRDPINAIGPAELVERALGSRDTYLAYKQFFGSTSPQIRGIQQAAKDKVLNLGSLGKSVDAAEFAGRLEALDTASPELLKDAFGKNAEMLRKEALVMLRAQGKQVPIDELNQALASGTLSASRLRDMITAETRRTEAYNNTLVRQLSEGTLKPDKIQPTQVVDRFVFNKDTQPAHLEELVRVAGNSPTALEDLRRLTFKKALDSVTVTDTRSGTQVLSGLDLNNLLVNPNTAKKLQTVLGEQSFADLQSIRDFLMPGIRTQEAFKSAGGLVAGSQINQLLGHGDLKAIPQFIKNFILSVAYTSDPVRAYFSNDVLRQEGKALVVNTAIASEPWLRALLTTFTKDAAKEVQATVKGYVDQAIYRNPASGQPGPSKGTGDIPWDEFLRRTGQPKP